MNVPKVNPLSTFYHWAMLLLLGLIWGSSFMLIKKGLIHYTPIQVACFRNSIASLCFLPVIIYHRKSIDWSKAWIFFLVGLTGTTLPSFLFSIAQTHVASSTAGVLNSLTPIFTLIFGILVFKNRFSPSNWFGILIGFSGALLIVFNRSDSNFGGSSWATLLIVLATVSYGLSINMAKYMLHNEKNILVSSLSYFLSGFPVLIYFIFTQPVDMLITTPAYSQSLWAMIILAVLGTAIASTFYYRLAQETSAIFASTAAYIMPLVAMIWGYFDHETITYVHFLAVGLILFGVYLTKKS